MYTVHISSLPPRPTHTKRLLAHGYHMQKRRSDMDFVWFSPKTGKTSYRAPGRASAAHRGRYGRQRPLPRARKISEPTRPRSVTILFTAYAVLTLFSTILNNTKAKKFKVESSDTNPHITGITELQNITELGLLIIDTGPRMVLYGQFILWNCKS